MIRNGPKGTVVPFNFFFFHKISMIDIKAPVKKARYKLITVFGKPNKNPRTKANFTSPNPMPFVFVIINNKKKNKNAPKALRNLMGRVAEFKKIANPKLIKNSAISIWSGMIPYSRSVKKITIKTALMIKKKSNSIEK